VRNYFAIGVAAILIAGCSSKIELGGEVFIENGGAATKLSNVDIQVIPEDKFIAFIKSRTAKVTDETTKINSEIQELEESKGNIGEAARDLIMAKYKRQSIGGWNTNSVGGVYQQQQQNIMNDQANAQVTKSINAMHEIESRVAELNRSIEGLKNGKNGAFFYSNNIPGALTKISTNSDGKYSFLVESDKRVALVASKGQNYWFLWVAPKGSKTLNLSNTNANDINCDICVFDGKTTPSSL
jgi:hypothetical protein